MTNTSTPRTLSEALDILEESVDQEALDILLYKSNIEPNMQVAIDKAKGFRDPGSESFERLQTNIEFGRWVRNRFDLWRGNDPLIDDILANHELDHSRCSEGECNKRHPDCVSAIIIDEFKKRMRKCQKTK